MFVSKLSGILQIILLKNIQVLIKMRMNQNKIKILVVKIYYFKKMDKMNSTVYFPKLLIFIYFDEDISAIGILSIIFFSTKIKTF